eukprot:1961367-Prymnesium_polylepis.1
MLLRPLLPSTDRSATASVGSPSCVPVPCASTVSMLSAVNEATDSASFSSFCCAAPLGAVILALRPSCCTALASICEVSLSLPVSWRSCVPAPSVRIMPLARASKVLQRPSIDSMPISAKMAFMCGTNFMLTADAVATLLSACNTAFDARWEATSPDEHAVSTVTVGPCRPKTKDIRPLATACDSVP